jgi:DNA-binding PadR family transcriptional regulator
MRCGPGFGFDFGRHPGEFAMHFGPRGPRGIDFGFGGADFDPFGGGFGRRGRRGRMFESGELRLVLLKLIADQPRHGYDLIRAIEELTHGSYAPSPGIVYPTLTMLQDMGFIEEAPGEGARKAFSITPEGRTHLEERLEEADALIARLADMGEGPRKARGGPVRRAVGNLLSALWQRVTREDSGEDVLHKVADILDEAARKIERL